MIFDRQDLHDLALGAAFLGTGGGGDPYIGRLMSEPCLNEGLTIDVIDPDEVPDDALVIPTAMMGAPTVLVEKIPNGDEPIIALKRLEEILGRKAYATMPIEVGGINSTIPLMVGARLGLPIVDADGMGRAFPELQMETFAVFGIPASPLVAVNEHGDSAVIKARNNHATEWFARAVTVRMGGSSCIAEYPMTGAQVKATSVRNTLTLARRIGRCIREARQNHLDPFQALLTLLPDTPYSYGEIIFRGKIVDVRRDTRAGFVHGEVKIEGGNGWSGTMEILVQNENLIARVDGRVCAVVLCANVTDNGNKTKAAVTNIFWIIIFLDD